MSTNNNNCRKYIEKSLALLLGFDIEDVVDVIEHLLTFESQDDLLEHLSSLLGREDDDVRNFVDDVVKYQNGVKICVDECDESAEQPSNFSISRNRNGTSATEKEKVEQQRLRLEQEKRKQKEDLEKKQKEEEKLIERLKLEQQREIDRIRKENSMIDTMKKTSNSHNKQAIKKKVTTDSTDEKIYTPLSASTEHIQKEESNHFPSKNKIKINEQKSEKKQSLPKQGKAKITCGCFGTLHQPLINCLHCGRIACTKEGYGYCPFCSYLIEEQRMITTNGDAFEKAILHKERLLQFDRDSASRTKVYDSQSDYYANSRSNWLSEKEQLDAKRKEEERTNELHTRKQMLELSI